MIIENNNTTIYNLLEQANKVPINYNNNFLFDFEINNNYNICIYNSKDKNFHLFIAENYIENREELIDLLNHAYDYFLINDQSGTLKENLIKTIEEKIHLINKNRLFFDAH